MIVNVMIYGSLAALLAALAACGLRRWRLAAAVSRAVVLSGPLILLASVAASVVVPLLGREPSMKATVLSQGVSEVVSCGAIGLAVSLIGAALWAFSRWRLRVAGRRAS